MGCNCSANALPTTATTTSDRPASNPTGVTMNSNEPLRRTAGLPNAGTRYFPTPTPTPAPMSAAPLAPAPMPAPAPLPHAARPTAKETLGLMTITELAHYLTLSRAAVYTALAKGDLPQPMQAIGRFRYWTRSQIDA